MDIFQILQEISENEHENYKAFKNRLIVFCSGKGSAVVGLFRILKRMEHELEDCLLEKTKIDVDRSIIKKVLRTIKIERHILTYRLKNPALTNPEPAKSHPPPSKWTDDKIDLIELIYAIQKSVNNGNVSIKALQECFEYVFDVDLGNIEERIEEIVERQGNKAHYLEKLINHLNHFHDEYFIGKSHHKLKWEGNIIDLVELIYSIHATGYTNTSLKSLFTVIGDVFDVELKDFYRVFKDIKNRVKGDRTKFLDELKHGLLHKMEKADEKPSRK